MLYLSEQEHFYIKLYLILFYLASSNRELQVKNINKLLCHTKLKMYKCIYIFVAKINNNNTKENEVFKIALDIDFCSFLLECKRDCKGKIKAGIGLNLHRKKRNKNQNFRS